MLTRQEIIDFCLSFPGAYEDYPFDSVSDPGTWTVMRHRQNKKSFALIYERNGSLCVNLKCDPQEADFLRQVFSGVTPGFHMNHVHWNTVTVGSDVPDEELFRQISESHLLICPKEKRRVKREQNTD